jgi:hypothetical protein
MRDWAEKKRRVPTSRVRANVDNANILGRQWVPCQVTFGPRFGDFGPQFPQGIRGLGTALIPGSDLPAPLSQLTLGAMRLLDTEAMLAPTGGCSCRA